MKKLILLTCAVLTLVSCGVRSSKVTEYKEFKDGTFKALELSYDSEKTTKQLDTIVKVSGDSAASSESLDNIVNKGDTLNTESKRHKSKTYYNKKTKKIVTEVDIKDYYAPVKIKETKEVLKSKRKDIVATGKQVIYDKKKDTKRNNIFTFIFVFIIIFVIYLLLRYKAKKKLLK